MTKQEINTILKIIFKKYVRIKGEINDDLQLSLMWDYKNPPDILSYTPPIEDLERLLNFGFEEEENVEMFDMKI
jgi:hypothetical protein